MRNLLIFAVLLLLTGGATYFLSGQHSLMGNPIPATRQNKNFMVAPDFKFKTLEGQTRSLSDFRGKVVVLNFWASWCTPCLIEFPQLLELAQARRGKMVLLAISLDEDHEMLERFLRKQNVKGETIFIGRDQNKKISRDLFQTVKLPETFLITPGGEIVEKIIGASVDFSTPEMQQKIDQIFDGVQN